MDAQECRKMRMGKNNTTFGKKQHSIHLRKLLTGSFSSFSVICAGGHGRWSLLELTKIFTYDAGSLTLHPRVGVRVVQGDGATTIPVGELRRRILAPHALGPHQQRPRACCKVELSCGLLCLIAVHYSPIADAQ